MKLTCRWTTDGKRVGVGDNAKQGWRNVAIVTNPHEPCLEIEFVSRTMTCVQVSEIVAYIQQRPWEGDRHASQNL